MAPDKFTITLHMVSSLDGLIAKNDNSVTWFETPDHYENGIIPTDIQGFLDKIDCYVMGSRTYELALELSKSYGWAYGDKPTIVLTSRKLPIERDSVELYNGDLTKLVNERLKPNFKNVWVVGGAIVSMDFILSNLADEIRLSVLPIILGEGVPFFSRIKQEHSLHLKEVTGYQSGMVELWYEIRK